MIRVINLLIIFYQVVQTAEVTALRGGKFMHTEDIKFLMRKDKVRMK